MRARRFEWAGAAETADGPPGKGACVEYSFGPTTWLPPIPALTTETRLPRTACRRRASTSGHRSSPFKVESVPSVIESPNATIAYASLGARMSSASRKYQEVVLIGKTDSLSSWLFAPAPGIETYDVWSAFACHVIGPLSPGTWKLTASFRPVRSALAGSRTKGKATASLHAS